MQRTPYDPRTTDHSARRLSGVASRTPDPARAGHGSPSEGSRHALSPHESRVLACIDRGLHSLGASAKGALYWHIEHAFGLRREEIPKRPQTFVYSMRQVFGASAVTVERAIARELRMAAKTPGDSRSLVELIEEALHRSEGPPAGKR